MTGHNWLYFTFVLYANAHDLPVQIREVDYGHVKELFEGFTRNVPTVLDLTVIGDQGVIVLAFCMYHVSSSLVLVFM